MTTIDDKLKNAATEIQPAHSDTSGEALAELLAVTAQVQPRRRRTAASVWLTGGLIAASLAVVVPLIWQQHTRSDTADYTTPAVTQALQPVTLPGAQALRDSRSLEAVSRAVALEEEWDALQADIELARREFEETLTFEF